MLIELLKIILTLQRHADGLFAISDEIVWFGITIETDESRRNKMLFIIRVMSLMDLHTPWLR